MEKNFRNICRFWSRIFFLPVLLGAILFFPGGGTLAGQPISREESSLFPLRPIFERMGYGVIWEAENKRAVLVGFGRQIVLYPQNPLFAINGIVFRQERPPLIEGGRLVVGLDFIQQAAGVSELFWDEDGGLFQVSFKEGGRLWPADGGLELNSAGEYPTRFLEVLLPEENRAAIGQSFEVKIGAPFVKGIQSYEIRFFYNPELIKIKDIRNPLYRQSEEFYMKRIDNKEGVAEYTLTKLGSGGDIPPRQTLVVIDAVAFRQGTVPFIKETLYAELRDGAAAKIPTAIEEKNLSIYSLY